MNHLETAIAKRLEQATSWPQFDAPQNLKEQKKIYKQFGVTYFVNHKEAMAYAKGKGFKVIDRSSGADAENGPGSNDLDFFYEVTDKSGKTVGLISGYKNEGEAWICPTAQHYKKWEKYQHGH